MNDPAWPISKRSRSPSTFPKGLKLTLWADADTPANAQLVHTALKQLVPRNGLRSANGRRLARVLNRIRINRRNPLPPYPFLAFGKLMISQASAIRNLLNDLKLEHDGARVKASLALTQEDALAFLEQALMMVGGGKGGPK